MSFDYGCVARETTILSQCALSSGNFDVIVHDILLRVDKEQTRSTYDQNRIRFFILSDRTGLNFVVSGPSSIKSEDAFSTLADIQRRFTMKFARLWQNATPYQFQNEFESEIRSAMQSERQAKIDQIRSNIVECQEIAAQNYIKALTRENELSEMQEESDKIAEYSKAFLREATKVRQKMCWEKYKWYLLVLVCVLLVIYVIVAISCDGLAFQGCTHHKDQSTNVSSLVIL